ncbi:MAG: anti sigma factor C-terminal domain-containing protein, partial [Clostridia bacterium]|nr:anti sigma factor C-terminal domain-containing protein [Clostridia bacterium]
MTFREIIKLYKEGTLPEEEKAALEAEIEKHEAISDYLFDDADIPGFEPVESEGDTQSNKTDKDSEKFTAVINASIRRAFVRTGIIVGSVVLAAVLAVIFVLPGFVSLFYYNPDEVVGISEYGFETERLDLDLSVYTELFLPTKYRNEAIIEAEGYGEYNIVIPQISSSTGRHLSVSGKLTRGELLMYDPNFFVQAPVNAFVINSDDYHLFSGTGAAGSSSDAFAALEELSDGTYYSAYFSLKELTEYEDFYKWYSSRDLPCSELWCGVYTSNISTDHLGFCPELSGKCIDWDRETYPRLCILDDHTSVSQMESQQASGEVM